MKTVRKLRKQPVVDVKGLGPPSVPACPRCRGTGRCECGCGNRCGACDGLGIARLTRR